MTRSNYKQVKVSSEKQALGRFKRAESVDCLINGYPIEDDNHLTPSLVYIELDNHVQALDSVLERIKQLISGKPMIIDSGSGFWVLQPVDTSGFIERFPGSGSFYEPSPSNKFLRFAGIYLSNGASRSDHYPSFKSCLNRMPGGGMVLNHLLFHCLIHSKYIWLRNW